MANLTLEEIGRLAGVSRSTVSRVVNHADSVRPEVRDRVLQVIAQTGYRPHAAARSLASNRTGVIGLVIPHQVHTLFEDPYFPLLIQGVSAACNSADLTLALYIFQSEEEEEDVYPRVAATGAVDGIIVTATRKGDPLLRRLAGGGTRFVVVGRPELAGVPFADVDNVEGGRLAARHLCSHGYARIAHIAAPATTTAGEDRRAGFVDGLADCGRTLAHELVREGDYTEASGYAAMRSLLPERPDAVFVATDLMAIGALRALREAALDVPDDVAIVGFDGLSQSSRAVPPLTTVRQPVAQTGAAAVELLLAQIHGDVGEGPHTVLPVELILRESCGRHAEHHQTDDPAPDPSVRASNPHRPAHAGQSKENDR